ncbi:MAG: tyrosine-protein phosphatase [Tistlia sp.]|uniref:tyrosine-protein phosphatase n=1 Tax=Tistlia sp. TaxID=3057121 RepID=UPI0034A1176C
MGIRPQSVPLRPLSGPQRAWGRVVARIHHFHWVDESVARSGQAYFGHTGLLLDLYGLRSLLNLRGENSGAPWYEAEKAACLARGLPLYSVALSSRRLPHRAALLTLLQALEQAPKPLLMKCSGGADRTGFAAGLHLVARHGRAGLPAARRQLARWPYLHLPKKQQKWLRPFFDFVEEGLGQGQGLHGTGERTLAEWIAEDYDPLALAAWLDARGLSGGWRPPARVA